MEKKATAGDDTVLSVMEVSFLPDKGHLVIGTTKGYLHLECMDEDTAEELIEAGESILAVLARRNPD